MGPVIRAGFARSTRVGWQLFFGGFLATGLLIVVIGLVTGLWALWLAGLMLVIPFGAMLIFARRRLSIPGPVIAIGPEGFHDRRLGQPIPWAVIRSLTRQKAGHRLLLNIGVDDPAPYLGNAGRLAGPMMRVNPKLGFPAINSRLDGLDVGQEVLAQAAEDWWRATMPDPLPA
jgi:hypothetical protein